MHVSSSSALRQLQADCIEPMPSVPYSTRSMQLGNRPFTRGTTRPVYRCDGGRQYVIDDDDAPVYGVWLHPEEYSEPVVIELRLV